MNDDVTTQMIPSRPALGTRARLALDALTPGEQGRVLRAFEPLARCRVGQGPWAALEPFPPDLRLLRIGDDLQAVFRLADGRQPEVIDIVRG
jgi:hypothetical protein